MKTTATIKPVKVKKVKIEAGTEFDASTMVPVKVIIKNEGHQRGQMVGPVWVEIEGPKKKNFFGEAVAPTVNYMTDNEWSFKPAVWFTYSKAMKIAKSLGVELEEC